MNNIVNKIIFNELSSRQSLSLPEIGSLWVEYISAEIADGETISPPENVVSFSPEHREGSQSIIEKIEATGVDSDTAWRVYNEWKDAARTSEGYMMDIVGEIHNGEFIPSYELHIQLNPETEEFTVVGTKKFSKAEKNWIILIVIFSAILLIGWGMWIRSKRDVNDSPRPNKTTTVITKDVRSTAPVETTETEQPVAEQKPQQEETVKKEPATQPAPTTTAVQATPKASVSGSGYYVVGGVFSTQENADKFIREMKAKYPDLDYGKHDFKGNKIMVSLYGSADDDTTRGKRAEIARLTGISDLWIHKIN